VSSGKTTWRHISIGFMEKTLFHHYVHFYESAYIIMIKKCMCA